MNKGFFDMSNFAEMNNVLSKNAELRDAFFECEEDYVKELKQKPAFQKIVRQLQKKYKADELNEQAIKVMNDIETGQVRSENLEACELLLICFLSAIVDLQHVYEHYKVSDENPLNKGKQR